MALPARLFILHTLIVATLVLGALRLGQPAAAAEVGGRVFAITGVDRDGDNLSIRVRSNEHGASLRVASLWVDGALIATEDGVRGFALGEEATLRFQLLVDAPRVNVTFTYDTYRGGNRTTFTESAVLDLPPAPFARVADAVLADAVARIVLENPTARTLTFDVSLEDKTGSKAGAPVFQRVRHLAPDARRELEFSLARRDLTEVVVVLEDGLRREPTKVLLRAASDNGTAGGSASLETIFPSREGGPSDTVEYSMHLKNLGADRLLGLAAEGLPAGYAARFIVQGNAVPSLRVAAGASQDLVLAVTIPPSAASAVGDRLAFAALVRVGGAELARLPLALSIHGAGRLDLEGRNWAASVAAGGAVDVTITVANTGTAPLRDVALHATAPTGWEVAFSPSTLGVIDAGARLPVQVHVVAPPDAGSGRYVLDLDAATADVGSRARSLNVEIAKPPAGGIEWVLAAAVVGAAGLGLMVKVRRR